MRPTALAAFRPWLAQFEGDLPGPYLDVRGLSTIGLALLCPLSVAHALDWTHLDTGSQVSPDDLEVAWASLVALPPGKGGGWYQSRVRIRATPDSLDRLTEAKLGQFEASLRKRIQAWDCLPGVCQIARMRTEWADGDAPWPKLDAALQAGVWSVAAQECHPSDEARQPAQYAQSYRAVEALYDLAEQYPGDDLPGSLPIGM